MNGERRQARRYHWLSEGLKASWTIRTPRSKGRARARSSISPIGAPRASRRRSSICFRRSGRTDRARACARLKGAREPARRCSRCCRIWSCRRTTTSAPRDVVARRLHGNLAAAADRGPADFSELLLTPGVGARTVRALAMVAEVVHGAPCRFSDPGAVLVCARRQGRAPVPGAAQGSTTRPSRCWKSAVQKAKLGRDEELGALKRLDDQARAARAPRDRSRARRPDRGRTAALTLIRGAIRVRMGATARERPAGGRDGAGSRQAAIASTSPAPTPCVKHAARTTRSPRPGSAGPAPPR